MKAPELITNNSNIRLVEPHIERDAALGVQWLEGEIGRSTLSLMGVAEKDNQPSSLDKERERVKGFIENDNQLNWMIQLDEKVVGTIWVDLKPTKEVLAPAVHIMIGDPESRGRGIGAASMSAVIGYLEQQGEEKIYSRVLAKNTVASKLLSDNGFQPLGDTYTDSDDLQWQNVVLNVSK